MKTFINRLREWWAWFRAPAEIHPGDGNLADFYDDIDNPADME